jgi:hypothetical protein
MSSNMRIIANPDFPCLESSTFVERGTYSGTVPKLDRATQKKRISGQAQNDASAVGFSQRIWTSLRRYSQ